jgi:iron complex outermembrane recepter protein
MGNRSGRRLRPAAFAAPVRCRPAGAALLLTLLAASEARSGGPQVQDLLDLSLEQLSDIEVTSVSRRAERLLDAAASIYVITPEAIRSAGAATLPEVLRLAPNLQVAQVNANNYAISARGFNNSLGNKLLVLIDGRTVYTPLFSGVFWDAQDVLIQDIERIEVISGPGATLWGANAVNGVINILTRPAQATQGGLLAADAASDLRSLALRQGGQLGAGGSYRVYAKQLRIDNTRDAAGTAQLDGWDTAQAGFRADWGEGAGSSFTLQGDTYRGESEWRPFGPVEVSGANLLARWNHSGAGGSTWRVQAYLDHTTRDDPVLFHDRMDVADIEFQHSLTADAHAIVWGGGYRQARDRVERGLLATFIPARRTLHWANVFVQDEVRLSDNIQATAGLKLDRNTYTGVEVLPSLRLAWKPDADFLLWAAASRAVRAPSRIDREFFLPGQPPFLIRGGPDFESEVSNVYELGLRGQGEDRFSWSLTAFHHDHDKLRSGQPAASGGGFFVVNLSEGYTNGIEAWATLRLSERVRLSAGLVELRQHLRQKPEGRDPEGITALGNDPRHQAQVRGTLELSPRVSLDLAVRGVSELPAPRVPGYVVVDAGASWQPDPRLRLALRLRNLADARHPEFAPGTLSTRSEYGREGMIDLEWRW